jgi:polygalacturonase
MRASIGVVIGFVTVFISALAGCRAAPPRAAFYDVRDYGAVPDGKTKNTEAIRKAIAAATANGGGTVLFSGGDFLTGPIHVTSNLTLTIDAGARLKFSQDFDDYLPLVRVRWEGTEVNSFSPLIYGDKVHDVTINGRGTLDGQGEAWWNNFRALKQDHKKNGVWKVDSKWQVEFAKRNQGIEFPDDPDMIKMGFLRPPFIQFLDSRNISIRDVTLVNSPFWNINPVYCDEVTVSGVTIISPDDSPNTDGIDPDSCRNVHISDCHISVGDDCITIKSGRDRQGRRIGRPAENYTITNSTMLRGHGGVVIGSEMSGGVSNIAISNCVFDGTDRGIRIKSTRGRGGIVEHVEVNNIVMRNIRDEALTLNLFYTDAPPEPFSERTPRFRDIHMSAITADAGQAALFLGLPESVLEDVSISNVNIRAQRGFVVKDARNLRLHSVHVDAVAGPAFSIERTEDIDLFDVGTRTPHPAIPVVELTAVKHAHLHGCLATLGTDVFARLAGLPLGEVALDGNDLGRAKIPIAASVTVTHPAR